FEISEIVPGSGTSTFGKSGELDFNVLHVRTDILYPISLGLISGLIPVYLGLLPLPLFRRLPLSGRNLLISFSIGILLFLFSDVMGEALELAENVGAGFSLCDWFGSWTCWSLRNSLKTTWS
ncbi:hypothetical protein MUP37_00490, partial [Candidatus Bathyarchaeota archaeon]|nr:hypothetical protein [Candidatus Bathyarchaeota archaeon]